VVRLERRGEAVQRVLTVPLFRRLLQEAVTEGRSILRVAMAVLAVVVEKALLRANLVVRAAKATTVGKEGLEHLPQVAVVVKVALVPQQAALRAVRAVRGHQATTAFLPLHELMQVAVEALAMEPTVRAVRAAAAQAMQLAVCLTRVAVAVVGTTQHQRLAMAVLRALF